MVETTEVLKYVALAVCVVGLLLTATALVSYDAQDTSFDYLDVPDPVIDPAVVVSKPQYETQDPVIVR